MRRTLQVTREELLEEDEYDDILKEVEEELEAKYGKLAAIVMPQPSKKGPANDPAGVGLVFVRFEELPRAVRCLFADIFGHCDPHHPMQGGM